MPRALAYTRVSPTVPACAGDTDVEAVDGPRRDRKASVARRVAGFREDG